MTTPPPATGASSARRKRARPEFNQLEIFLKVVETRSFAAAARQTGRTQPAVSQAMARLEEIYGGDLFERRRGAPLTLTPIGEAVLPSARALLHMVDQQMVRAAQTAQSRAGKLTVGFYPGLASGPLREGLRDFMAASPEVELHFVEGVPSDLHRQLNDRTIDILLGALMPDISSNTLIIENLWQERLFLALPADHVLAAKEKLDWDDVASVPLLLRTVHGEVAGYRAIVARLGDRPFRYSQHAVSRGTLIDLVALGLGGVVAFESTITPYPGVVSRPIHDDEAIVFIKGVWHAADRNPLRHRLLTHIRQYVRPIQP